MAHSATPWPASDTLKASDERFRLLVESVQDYAIFILDPTGHVATWNAGAERLKRYRAEEIIGEHFSRFYTEEDLRRGHPENELRQAIAEGRYEEEGWRIRKDGTRFWASVIITALWDDEGQLCGFAKVTRDLTERKRAEEALRHSNEMLEERVRERTEALTRANEALQREIAERDASERENRRLIQALQSADQRKDQFLAMLAHELRNPLGPIRNAAQLLEAQFGEVEGVRRTTDILERQVQHMTRLIHDLLDASRLRHGKIALQKERVDLNSVVASAVETARPYLKERRQELRVIMPAEPIMLEADPTRLEQIVGNILHNAVKYTDPGGRVEVTAARESGMATLRVRDNGRGISPDLLPHVFDLFTQADGSLAHTEGGLGIGLALVHALVEMHGGAVEALSAGAGQGSEFVVRLPLGESTGVGAGEVRKETASGPVRPVRVLLVEDNVDAAETLVDLVELWGHEIRAFHDGSAALEAVAEFRPDVVLVDIGLPGMDGYEIARRLRAGHGYRMTLVAVTGYGQPEDRRRTLEAGFDHHLVKPLDLRELERLLAVKAEAGS